MRLRDLDRYDGPLEPPSYWETDVEVDEDPDHCDHGVLVTETCEGCMNRDESASECDQEVFRSGDHPAGRTGAPIGDPPPGRSLTNDPVSSAPEQRGRLMTAEAG